MASTDGAAAPVFTGAYDVPLAPAPGVIPPPAVAVPPDAVGGTMTSPAFPPHHVAGEPATITYHVPPAVPGLRKINDLPPMYEMDNFLTDEECESIKRLAAPGLRRSIVVDGKDGKTAAPSRTSSSCFLNKHETVWLGERVAAVLGKPVEHQEPPQVAHYTTDQMYAAHYDAFDMTTGPGCECALTGGQRVATVLVYLNDCPEGGGTYFPKLDIRFRPVKGKLVIFFPCSVTGQLDPAALHTGEPAVGEKWLCQVWVRQTDFGRKVLA